ncbi:metalloregulator ArsR/SmtB family transcription factor [Stutzerimonas urumqiensis]|uniref:metalloregulator ArsR/SmtB family transcription factor n=1 Tax=Stutzerimonas urumqiensis TaxID=638269 RepID=UPI003BA84FF9
MSDSLTPPALLKCLADDTRLRLMLCVAETGECCVCELTTALGQSQPKVSRHLAQLRACHLLADRRQGQWVYYRLHSELPDWIRDLLHGLLVAHRDWLAEDTRRLAALRDGCTRLDLCS